jgi:transposase, IS30 family
MQSTAETTRSYRVLSHEEREEIMIGRRTGTSLRTIAKRLHRNVSVISREIRANSTEDGRYQAYWARTRSTRRRKSSRKRPRIRDSVIQRYIEEKLKIGWSPEQIAGRLPIDKPGKRVSYETIYQFIFKTRRDLTQYLQCGRKQRRKRKDLRKKRVLIPERVGIEQRPAHINDRIEHGHWEGDTAVSRQSTHALMVLQERSLGLTFLRKLPRCAPKDMADAVISRLENLPSEMLRSITFDNGQENRHHLRMQEQLGLDIFFCDPYSSWQKGSVEHAVGLTRRFWPKKTDYALIPDEEIAMVEYRLNTRPRKRFGFLSPLEYASRVALTGRMHG